MTFLDLTLWMLWGAGGLAVWASVSNLLRNRRLNKTDRRFAAVADRIEKMIDSMTPASDHAGHTLTTESDES